MIMSVGLLLMDVAAFPSMVAEAIVTDSATFVSNGTNSCAYCKRQQSLY